MKQFGITLFLLVFVNFWSFSQSFQTGMNWLSTTGVSNSTSPNYTSGNCTNINYNISSSQTFRRTNNGAPYNNNCLYMPSNASNTATFINMTITFNQPVNNLRIRFIDLDENNSGLPQPEESLTQINPTPSSVSAISIANPFYLVGNTVTPFDNNPANNNNNTAGWINWNGNVTSISFRYNRPSSVNAGLIIDSIYFDCPINCSLTADAGPNITLCNSNSSTIDATNSNATSYLWNTGETTPSINISSAGVYWVEISDNNCTDIDSVVVSNNNTPSVQLGNDTTLCNYSTLTLNPNISNGSFLWSNNTNSATLTVNQSGQYWVEVSNSCGLDRDTINVTFESPPIVNLGNDTTICTNSTLNLNGSTSNATYLWQDNSINSTFTVSQAGNYWVRISSGACIASDTILVGVISPPNVQLGNDTSVCSNLTTEIIPIYSGGNATILWNDNSIDSTLIINNSGIYWIEVENQCAVVRDSINVTVEIAPVLNFGNDTTVCTNIPLILNPNIPFATYIWQDNSTNSTFTVSQTGNYAVTVSSGVCIVSDSITISTILPPNVQLSNDTTVCSNLTTELIPIYGGGNATILWNDNSFDSTLIVNNSGIYWIEVENQCAVVRDSINVTVEIPPAFDLGNDTTICENSTLILNPNIQNATYVWQNNSSQPTFSVNQAGVYWVDVSTGNCLVRDSIIILTQNAPIVNLGNDITLCNGTSTVLNAFYAGANYSWQDNSNSPTLMIDQPGTYWVDVSNICGTLRDTFILTIQNPPQINFSNDTTFCLDESISLSAFSQGANYLWQDNSTNSSLIVNQAGLYSVVVTVGVCQVEHDFMINVKICNSEIEMPTIFTPNGDGINDYFTPVSYSKIKNYTILIVNRWGNVIYNNSNLLSGWDGTSNGKECLEGVYFWKVNYEDFNSSKFTEHGFLHLTR